MAEAFKAALTAAAQLASAVKYSRLDLVAEIQRQLVEHSGRDLAATLKLLPDAELEEAYHVLCQLFDDLGTDGGDSGRKTVLATSKSEVAIERSRRQVGSWRDGGGSKQDAVPAAGSVLAPVLLPVTPLIAEGVVSAEPLSASTAATGEAVARLTALQAADLTASQRELAARIKCKLGEWSESRFVLEFKQLPNAEMTEWFHLLKLILEELVEESKAELRDNPAGSRWLQDQMSRRRKAQSALKEYYELSITSSLAAPTTGRAAASRVAAGKRTSRAPAEEATTATATATAPDVKPSSVESAGHAAAVRPGSASSPYRETREEAAAYVTKYTKLRYQYAQRLRQKYFSQNHETELKIGEFVVTESCEDPVMTYLTGSEPDWPPNSGFQFLSRPEKRRNLKTEARRI